MLMALYKVEWAMEYEAEDHMDAARQAWAALDDATKYNSGASILFVTDESDGYSNLALFNSIDSKAVTIDMENVGFCDDCDKSYLTYSNEDHCTHCGNCKIHCTDNYK